MTPPEPIRTPLDRTIDRESFTPAYLSLVDNAHVWGGSRIYNEHFGVTSPDFAILSTLSNRPGCQAVDISEQVALDKSVVSRRLQRLRDKELICWEQDGSRRRLYLTSAGARVHDAVLPVALERAELMLAGFTEEERAQLQSFLRRMYENIPLMNHPPSLEPAALPHDNS
ncbi:MarR family winged helix-turn-helix transcriptional regulator [Citricoccus nitrophenolicus]|uniref:MarR family winged helix-turn-helix transcriptional regulator n=1 Tax=Citricoccus nitrophenolicus TaxID=863575 RepID=UPI0039B44AE5